MYIDRRQFFTHSLACATGAALAAQGCPIFAADDRSLEIANEPQLLIDDWLIERCRGLKRTLHPAKKQGLIKESDGSDWQRGGVYHGNMVHRDSAGKFHMTYRYYWWDAELAKLKIVGQDKAHWFHETTGYATSDDGIHWHKPKLGLFNGPSRFTRIDTFPFEKPEHFSTENNLGCPLFFIHDLQLNSNISDPAEQFLLQTGKMEETHPYAKPVDAQMYYAAEWPDFANDRNWQEKLTPIPGGNLSPRRFKELNGYDHAGKEWFVLCQDEIGNWLKRGGRDIARFTSPDLVSWNGPELVLPVAADESRQSDHWIEYMDMAAYRVGGKHSGAWLGQLVVFDSDRTNRRYETPGHPNVWRKGVLDLRLILSRDAGRTWQRVGDKQVWLPHHESEDGYDRLVFASYPVQVGDELRFYYSCWNGDHLVFNRDGTTYYPNRLRNNSTAWATLRLDGYGSLDSEETTGELLTKPIRFNGDALTVNFAAPAGALRVELQDSAGKPLDGFSAAECVPTRGDGVALTVRWRERNSLRQLNGRAIRARFLVEQGSLYAFQFA